jgi:hypothetical protein
LHTGTMLLLSRRPFLDDGLSILNLSAGKATVIVAAIYVNNLNL